MIRCPLVLERLNWDAERAEVTYQARPKRSKGPSGAIARWDALEFIARITDHIPEPGQQLIRNWGYYANASRAKRRRESGIENSTEHNQQCCSHGHHADFRAGFRRGPVLATLPTAGPAREESQRWQLAARFAAHLTRCAVLRCSESRSSRFSSRPKYTSSGVRAPRTARGIFSLCSRT